MRLEVKSEEVNKNDTLSTFDGDQSVASDLSFDYVNEEKLSTGPFSQQDIFMMSSSLENGVPFMLPKKPFKAASTSMSQCRDHMLAQDSLKEDILQREVYPNPDAVYTSSSPMRWKRDNMHDQEFQNHDADSRMIPRCDEDLPQQLKPKSSVGGDYSPNTMGIDFSGRHESRTHRTMLTTKERRAAFDSLMSRKRSNSFSSEWQQLRHRSAPNSPALPALRGLQISDFTIDDANENRTEQLLRPASAPVSPAFSSLRSFHTTRDTPPHMMLEAVNRITTSSGRTDNYSAGTLMQRDEANTESVPTIVELLPLKKMRSVGFTTVQIRSYERILGDNPSCTDGPSVSIGWKYKDNSVLQSVDEYEEQRTSSRSRFVPILSRHEREAMLMDLGYTRSDIANALRDNVRTRNRRRQTVTNLYAARAEDAAESISRWMRRRFTFSKKASRKKQGKATSGFPQF